MPAETSAAKRGQQDHLRQGGGPDPRSRGGEQLGVAPAQPLAPAQRAVDRGDRGQAQIAERGAQAAVGQAFGIEGGAGNEPGDDERKGQSVGQQPAAQIDPAEGEKPPAQQAIEPTPVPAIDQHGDQPRPQPPPARSPGRTTRASGRNDGIGPSRRAS